MLDHDELRRLCGDVPEWKLAALVDTGASREEIEAALVWAEGQSDVMGEERVPMSGQVARVYEILMADEESWEEEPESPE